MTYTVHTSPKPRRHDLDWLRVGAFAVLIAYHIGMFYVSWDWHIKSRFHSDAIEPVMRLVNPWRLALLFLISGMALRYALDRVPVAQLCGLRLKRLGLPLMFGFFVLCAPQSYFELLQKGEIGADYWAFYMDYLDVDFEFSILTPAWNHLWYLLYLLVYTLIICAAAGPADRLAAYLDGSDNVWLGPFLLAIVPVIFTVASVALADRFPITHDLVNDWFTHAISLTAMLFGYLVARAPSFWQCLRQTGLWAAACSVVLGAIIVADLLPLANSGLVRLIYAWCIIIALLAAGDRYLNRNAPLLGYLNKAILPYYVLHQTLIVSLGALATASRLPLVLEVCLVMFGTIAGCLIGYELIRRVAWLRPLFGLPLRSPGSPANPIPSLSHR